MKKLELGKSGCTVAELGLGCINFGTTTDEDTAFRLIETFLDKGGNLLDTSNNYAFWNGGDGRDSERTIGKWLKGNDERRKDIVLTTKLGALPIDLKKGFDQIQGTGRKVIFNEVEKSLNTLQTDYIDLLYLHIDDYKTPQEETMEALSEIVRKGYVKNIGCSNFRTWRIEKARQICEKGGYPFFSAVQQRYSYFQPVMDADFDLQIAADKELDSYIHSYKDITMVSHTSLLHGAYFKDSINDPLYNTEENRKRLKKVKTLGENAAPWVLKYITKQFGGSVALFTSANITHLIQNINFFNRD